MKSASRRVIALAVGMASAAALAAAPAPAAAPAKPVVAAAPAKKLTLLVTGDNRGEIAPCG